MTARRPTDPGADDELRPPAWLDSPAPERRAAGERRAGQRREAPLPRPPQRRPVTERRGDERRKTAARRHAAPGQRERRLLLTTTLLLLLYGLVMAYSASTAKAFFTYGSSWYMIERQAFFAVIGLVAMVLCARIDYVWLRRAAVPLWIFALATLLLVLVPGVGSQINGARRWFLVAGFSYSPSELAKLASVCLIAGIVIRRPADLLKARGFMRIVVDRHPAGGRAHHGRARPRHDADP